MIHTNSHADLNPLLGQTEKNPQIGHDMQVGQNTDRKCLLGNR